MNLDEKILLAPTVFAGGKNAHIRSVRCRRESQGTAFSGKIGGGRIEQCGISPRMPA